MRHNSVRNRRSNRLPRNDNLLGAPCIGRATTTPASKVWRYCSGRQV